MAEDQNIYIYGGTAFAVGDETFTMVETTSTIVDNGAVTKARIDIKATAVGSTYADASTDVYSNSDISLLINFEQNALEYEGVIYDVSRAKFIGISLPDHVDVPDGSTNKVVIINLDENLYLDPALADNLAGISIEAEVVGDTTFLNAEAATLTTDTISMSEISIIAVA